MNCRADISFECMVQHARKVFHTYRSLNAGVFFGLEPFNCRYGTQRHAVTLKESKLPCVTCISKL